MISIVLVMFSERNRDEVSRRSIPLWKLVFDSLADLPLPHQCYTESDNQHVVEICAQETRSVQIYYWLLELIFFNVLSN